MFVFKFTSTQVYRLTAFMCSMTGKLNDIYLAAFRITFSDEKKLMPLHAPALERVDIFVALY